MEPTGGGGLGDPTAIYLMQFESIIFEQPEQPAALSSRVALPSGCHIRLKLTPPSSGFTLLELAVLLFIIGLVLAIAMPRFRAFQGAELRSESRRLAARSHYLYEEAGAQKVLLRLNFDLNHNVYFVTRLDPFARIPSFMPERGPAGGVVSMSADVRLRDVWVEGAGLFRNGIVGCQFYPNGIADAAVIHLLDRNGDVITLGIDPSNGAVVIIPGDLSPDAFQQQASR